MTVESNVNEVIARINARAGRLQGSYEAIVSNNTEYAAAVDQGSTRRIVWAELAPAHRAAIIMAMKKRKGQARRWEGGGLEVMRGEGWVEITVPGAGMLAQSVGPVKKFGRMLLQRLPNGFGDAQVKMAVMELALFAQSTLVGFTPVDQGVLVKGWEVRVG